MTKQTGLYAPDGSYYVTLTDGNGNPTVPEGGRAVYVDRSGTIATGGTAQSAAAANTSRGGFWIQNQSTGDLWISTIATAVANEPSLWLPPGSFYKFDEVPSGAISIIGATTGQAFAAREW